MAATGTSAVPASILVVLCYRFCLDMRHGVCLPGGTWAQQRCFRLCSRCSTGVVLRGVLAPAFSAGVLWTGVLRHLPVLPSVVRWLLWRLRCDQERTDYSTCVARHLRVRTYLPTFAAHARGQRLPACSYRCTACLYSYSADFCLLVLSPYAVVGAALGLHFRLCDCLLVCTLLHSAWDVLWDDVLSPFSLFWARAPWTLRLPSYSPCRDAVYLR